MDDDMEKESDVTLLSASDASSPRSIERYSQTRCRCCLTKNCAQPEDFYPNHIIERSANVPYVIFSNSFLFGAVWFCCCITCVSVICGPIASVVSFKGLQFTIPSMGASLFSMLVKIVLSLRLEPLVDVYYVGRLLDIMVIVGVPILFCITCTPYDYIVNPDSVARERNTPHNHNGREVLSFKFTFIPIWVFMAVMVLIRFVRLNLSMVYERRTFKNRNCEIVVLRGIEYQKQDSVCKSDIKAWFKKLDKYIGRYGTLMVCETILFGVSFVSLMSSFLLDGFLGPIDTCLAFTSVLLFLPSLFFILELSRINKDVSKEYSYKFVGEGNIYNISYAEMKVLGGLMITIAGAILNIKI